MNHRSTCKLALFLASALIVSFSCAASAKQLRPQAKPSVLRAGAVATDITPQKFPISMSGQFYDRQAVAALDPLHARAVVLDDGTTKLAIVVCDSCLIPRNIFDRAKQIASQATGIPVTNMLMSATHTHTSATTISLCNCEANEEYVEFLTQQIAKSVIDAQRRLEPAKAGWGVIAEPSEVSNRRWSMKPGAIPADPFGGTTDRVMMNPPVGSADLLEPAGPVDPDISFLSVQAADGRPLALLANYSLHYVGGIPADQLSADYFGEFARQITQRLGGDEHFVGIMSNGTSGDVNNIQFRDPRPKSEPFERVKSVASKVADKTFAAYQKVDHRSSVPLSVAESEIELGVRRPTAAEVAYAQEILSKLEGPVRKSMPEVYAYETVLFSKSVPTVTLKLQAMQIGELSIGAIPCETFADIGLSIKKRSPHKPTFVISLANGYNGYLPTPQHHKLGGYETWRSSWSYLEVEASTKIEAELLSLLGRTPKAR